MTPDAKKPAEEIDLLYFFYPLINFVRLAFHWFLGYCRIILRNASLFLLILLLFSAAAYLFRYVLPKYYVTNAVFISHYLPGNVALLSVNEINTMASSSHDRKNLADSLKISASAAAAIHSIDAQTLNSPDYKYKFDTAAGAAFNVTLKLSDIAYLQEIQKGLAIFLENNIYSVSRKNARIKVLNILRDNLLDKEHGLDSLKATLSASVVPNTHSQVVIMGQPVVPFELYEKQQDYIRERKLIELEMKTMENIELVQPFPVLSQPNEPDFKKILYRGIITGLIFAMILTPLLRRKARA